MSSKPKQYNQYSLYAMGSLYLLAGINHFVNPEMYLKIMPDWLCCQKQIVLLSGVAEIALALLLFVSKTRKLAAWSIIMLLVLVFPANVQAFVNHLNAKLPLLWLSAIRLPLQAVLIWWAYQFTKPSNPKNGAQFETPVK